MTTANKIVAIYQELHLRFKRVLEGQFAKEPAAVHAHKHAHTDDTLIYLKKPRSWDTPLKQCFEN